jgi:hypothetical protein
MTTSLQVVIPIPLALRHEDTHTLASSTPDLSASLRGLGAGLICVRIGEDLQRFDARQWRERAETGCATRGPDADKRHRGNRQRVFDPLGDGKRVPDLAAP